MPDLIIVIIVRRHPNIPGVARIRAALKRLKAAETNLEEEQLPAEGSKHIIAGGKALDQYTYNGCPRESRPGAYR